MTNTRNPDPMQVPISFADRPGYSYGLAPLSENFFGIWSCRFSADGNEVIAGGNGKIFGP
jgi:DDB1- and CUL4-associated factor 11